VNIVPPVTPEPYWSSTAANVVVFRSGRQAWKKASGKKETIRAAFEASW
jgi:hypothetical protein